VWLPDAEFIEKLFLHATKPRIINTLCKAYLHHAQDNSGNGNYFIKLFKTYQLGMKGSDGYEHH